VEDVQERQDFRGIALDKAGVSNVCMPITVLGKDGSAQATVATVSMSASVTKDCKGTHMSRFLEILNEQHNNPIIFSLPSILKEVRSRLNSDKANVSVCFPYFISKEAPISKSPGLMDYRCEYFGESCGDKEQFILSVTVPVTSVCPCSKAISDYGAHNQRGKIKICIKSSELVWIDELVDIAESAASSPVYPVMKRPDERYVTMQAYDNPVFVEDMVRNTAELLRGDNRITWFSIQAINKESIHNHDAFAELEETRQQDNLNP
jgi:GTP cyclohydrolase I